MDRTTISVSTDTKRELEDQKPVGVTWDAFLTGLIEGSNSNELDADAVAERVASRVVDQLHADLR